MLAGIFGPKKKTPEEMAKEWKLKLNGEQRNIDRQVRKIQQELKKVEKAAKASAKQGDMVATRMIAREIVHSRVAVKRLIKAKTQINSVQMQLQQQMSQMKLAGSISKSTDVMKHMNRLCRVTEISAVMQQMSAEMTKAGLIEEMVNDTLDDALNDDVSEGEAEEEVNRVIEDVLQDKLGPARVARSGLPQTAQAAAAAQPAEQEVEENDEMDDAFQARLAALRQ